MLRVLIILATIIFGQSCNEDTNKPDHISLQSAAQGKEIYSSRCMACHGESPASEGNIGPMIYGISKELLRKKVIEGKYPKDYAPKRKTKNMNIFPELKDQIKYLHDFLNSDDAL
jgi:mono/diheme cytochrome c family protein